MILRCKRIYIEVVGWNHFPIGIFGGPQPTDMGNSKVIFSAQ